ncbi:outer membrane protein transport protein [Guyparkeria halophila]|uniref:Outer membrane protein transport protein n=1 Tax=Guyparkeria halophila TaxID=47960 RepID=A0ABZ0YYW2_9GAMM|nr:outer membrane protein transport protein [Guyparkeria halophila]WQH17386.1 outer membrane protein transport protein [Guyparkeria halophila]
MTFKRTLLAAAITGATFAAGTAHATNGYFSHGFGVKSQGMAGGGVAFANNSAMVIATNPAGLTAVDNQVGFEISWFRPERGYSQTSGSQGNPQYDPGQPTGGMNVPTFPLPAAQADSDSERFIIPGLSASYALTENDSIGIAVYGNGGLNTDFAPDADTLAYTQMQGGTYDGGAAGVNLEQLFIAPTYARSFMDDKLSVGVSALIVRQKFRAKGIGGFGGYSTDAQNLSNNGHEKVWGYGGKVGVTFKPTDRITLGASYQSEVDTDNFDKYAGLFAEEGDFDIPSTWTVGLAAAVTDDWTVTFDYQRINYSDVKAVSNPSFEYLTSGEADKRLGGSNGAGFGWDDINVYKLGVQWQATPHLQLRAGWNRGDNPIGSDEVLFNTIAPGVMENHYTAGLSYSFDQNHEIHGAFMYAPEVSVTGVNPLTAGTGDEAQTTIRMKQYQATVGYTYKF